jgi:DNA-directed RNA polymerase alpha subunit
LTSIQKQFIHSGIRRITVTEVTAGQLQGLKELVQDHQRLIESDEALQNHIREIGQHARAILDICESALGGSIAMPAIFRESVEHPEFSIRTYNCLKNASIQTIGELVVKTEQELLCVRNFSRKSSDEIAEVLATRGLRIGMTEAEMRAWTPPDSNHATFQR